MISIQSDRHSDTDYSTHTLTRAPPLPPSHSHRHTHFNSSSFSWIILYWIHLAFSVSAYSAPSWYVPLKPPFGQSCVKPLRRRLFCARAQNISMQLDSVWVYRLGSSEHLNGKQSLRTPTEISVNGTKRPTHSPEKRSYRPTTLLCGRFKSPITTTSADDASNGQDIGLWKKQWWWLLWHSWMQWTLVGKSETVLGQLWCSFREYLFECVRSFISMPE